MRAQALFQQLETPCKSATLLIAPSGRADDFDAVAVDCPFPFRHEGCYWMTYVGWDGVGYQTGLARSDDLLTWEKKGLFLGRGDKGSVTQYNAAMTCILRDNHLYGPGELRRVDGRYVGTYHAYPESGYETGPGVIGLCYSQNLRTWEVASPVLTPDPSCLWEAGGLYKSWIMEADGTYYLFYNARDKHDKSAGPWTEQIGLAVSTDLITWERHPRNPLVKTGAPGAFDDRFASDPCVFRHQNIWIMFYFGNSSDGHARDGFAWSEDLIHWEKGDRVLVDVGPDGAIDARHAHKPGIIARNDCLYHFYCAVGISGGTQTRGIALASQRPARR